MGLANICVLSCPACAGESAEEKKRLYSNIAGASESGWDFSSRWFDNPSTAVKSFANLRTEDIVPVDLNAFLCLTEKHLAFFYEQIGRVYLKLEGNMTRLVSCDCLPGVCIFWQLLSSV